MNTPETSRLSLTRGVAEWLGRLVETMPGLAPLRPAQAAEDPGAAGWLHRFARDTVTADPVTHQPLSNIQIFLIESALDCVDWEALARDPRLRRLDWAHASLTQP